MPDWDSDPEYVPLGPRPYLDRLLDEYWLTEADVQGKIARGLRDRGLRGGRTKPST